MTTIFVSGALANKPLNGGEAWVRLSWLLGLKKLGLKAVFVEEIAAATCLDSSGQPTSFEESINLAYFKQVAQQYGIDDAAILIYEKGAKIHGATRDQLFRLADECKLLVNISGHLSWPELMSRIAKKAYIDIDPGFTQFWHADPDSRFKLGGHDAYYTIGRNIGSGRCTIPTGNIKWRHIDPPNVMTQWPRNGSSDEPLNRFTTVAAWRGSFGPVYFGGENFGLKVHEFRKMIELPKRTSAKFEIALDIHPGDAKDRDKLLENGWTLVDPRVVARGPMEFRNYVQQSGAEFSVAQGIYVQTNSGWFSDRTVRYLASGKPALVQHTGWTDDVGGEGLVTFRTLDEAIAGAESIRNNYDRHCAVARQIAENHFDSDIVLRPMLAEMGIEA